MARNRLQEDEVIDYIGEKTQYWNQAAKFAERILSSDNPSEIVADFVTKLAFKDVDADEVDPIDILQSVSADWGVAISEDDEDYEDLL
jgi:hypothetical protein